MGFSRQEHWSGLPFPSPVDHILSDLSTMTRPSCVAPGARLGFIELRLWSMWLDWLVFCEYGFSVSAFWCPLATPTILLGFLLPWAWGISSLLLQQSAAAALYLGWGVSNQDHLWEGHPWEGCLRATFCLSEGRSPKMLCKDQSAFYTQETSISIVSPAFVCFNFKIILNL